ncbi:MAG: DUF1028 domain-containing protein [Hyphomicrobiaceae bacterium]|nr:MAG: DUF1028 domain-containing protein [Hyphomicrobiaceae bacterium]
MTWSIVVRDKKGGAPAIAVATCAVAVGNWKPEEINSILARVTPGEAGL